MNLSLHFSTGRAGLGLGVAGRSKPDASLQTIGRAPVSKRSHRKPTDEESSDYCCVPWDKKPKAGEDDAEPEHLNWRAPHHLCWYSYVIGDYTRAVEAGRTALRANSNQCLSHAWLASSLGQLGRIEEARNIMARLTNQIRPLSFSDHVQRQLPWVPDEAHSRLLDGLRKSVWREAAPT